MFCHFVAYISQKPLRTPLGAACAVSRSFGKITSLLFLSFETERLYKQEIGEAILTSKFVQAPKCTEI